jgi:archaellum biogenesis protein FlaJ (TadC family)
VISLNLVLAGLRLGLKNRQVGEKWVADDCSYLCKGLSELFLAQVDYMGNKESIKLRQLI